MNEATQLDAAAEARRIHSDLPVFDGHNDLPWAIRIHAESDLDVADPGESLPQFHTDIARLRRGGVGAQFWSVYVPSWSEAPLRHTVEQIDLTRRMIDRHPSDFELADTAADVQRIRGEGKIACLLGAEGGHAIEESLGVLRTLYRLGVRYMTLTHGSNVSWADSATDDPEHGGLTAFGRRVVAEMNRVGMLVDISHVSVDTMSDALDASTAPVIASHSSAAAIADHPRNIPDDILRRVAAGRGVVMVNFYPGFLTQEAATRSRGMFARERRLRAELGDDLAVEQEIRRLDEADPIPRGSVEDVVDHIEHIAAVAGVDHVGIGSDFDGIEKTPVGLEDVAAFPAITERLLVRGWGEPDVRKVLGDNIIRVLGDAEALAPR